MSGIDWIRLGVYLAALLLLARPLGAYMARVFEGDPTFLGRVLGPVERAIYRIAGVDPRRSMNWKAYALAMLAFQVVGFAAVYALQRFQASLPLNPQGLGAVTPHLAFDTAVSFVTNTNWQAYGGESTLGYLTQMLGLTVQNFVSAATGLAILVAFIRGLAGRTTRQLGNFWVDLVRATVHVLLPLSLVVALVLVSQGVVQTLAPYVHARLLDGGAEQVIAVGPAASQVAIKQLGTNGGGFFSVNSAHPLENPTPFSNLVEVLSILLLPAACCFLFGRMIKDQRQGHAVLLAMLVMFVPLAIGAMAAERAGNPVYAELGVLASSGDIAPGGNMEGKEARLGPAESALWATATTAASNGSVNSMHDSFTPLGGLVPMFLMQLGEVVFGGVGSGLYGMLVFAIVTVFLAGLMVGRTPEYLGKKIEAYEVQMSSIVILAPCVMVLIGTALACATGPGLAAIQDRGAHGFSEMLYALSSASNNNGSAFAGLGAATPFYDLLLGVAMLVGRYLTAVPALAIAGSLAAKKTVPAGPGTMPTHGPLFVVLLVAVVLIVGALNFVPALALGPIVEHLRLP
jgi:potassium-transporting ATPase potassium-binding subunit